MQIYHMTNAINQNLEMLDVVQVALEKVASHLNNSKKVNQDKVQAIEDGVKQGETLKTDLRIKGSKIYTDASWKTRRSQVYKELSPQVLEFFATSNDKIQKRRC